MRVRGALHAAALRLGRAIGYDSLGTAEFILEDGGDQPWFLEMNTRLQVEHTVTEEVTGLDLVEWQIRIARGETLPLQQDQITSRGAAIEARLNAEDPAAGYRPGTGTLLRFDAPGGDGVRVDTGVRAGTAVTPHYDSQLAKIVASGADRDEALARLCTALERLVVLGVTTNQAFLRDTVGHPRFRAGELTTRFLDEAFPDGWRPATAMAALARNAAVAVWMSEQPATAPGPWATLGGFRLTTPAGRPARLFLTVEDDAGSRRVEVAGTPSRFEVTSEGETRHVTAWRDRDSVTASAGGISHNFAVAIQNGRILLSAEGQVFDVRVVPEIEHASAAPGAAPGGPFVTAAMPGLISAVEVKVGQRVANGQTAVVMEAMKVVLRLPAPVAGTVARVLCGPGETVKGGAVLVEIDPD